jgi:hypothetical protein
VKGDVTFKWFGTRNSFRAGSNKFELPYGLAQTLIWMLLLNKNNGTNKDKG